MVDLLITHTHSLSAGAGRIEAILKQRRGVGKSKKVGSIMNLDV